jgi:hypothetical protein
MACSDLWAIHQRYFKECQKMRFSSHLASDKITTRGYKTSIFTKCITIMIRWFGCGMVGHGCGLAL